MPSAESFTAVKPFDSALKASSIFPLVSSGITNFQVNMGQVCNQACRHCHAEAGPQRRESMPDGIIDACLGVLKNGRYPVVDITGGAPEMNPGYRRFVLECAALGLKVKTRSNLTILLEKGNEDLPRFYADNNVEVIASLPYFLEATVDRQRGKGIFSASIEALKRLNEAGYGMEGGLTLNLVFNPCGAYLPPPQKSIEADFRKELMKRHGIMFSNLFTITNMPIGRFLKFLKDSGNLSKYFSRLASSYNPAAAANVMCRNTLSVGWDGALYDCDFNQMLGLKCGYGAPQDIADFDPEKLDRRTIVTGAHCYGCTAGAGSSCTGSVV